MNLQKGIQLIILYHGSQTFDLSFLYPKYMCEKNYNDMNSPVDYSHRSSHSLSINSQLIQSQQHGRGYENLKQEYVLSLQNVLNDPLHGYSW